MKNSIFKIRTNLFVCLFLVFLTPSVVGQNKKVVKEIAKKEIKSALFVNEEKLVKNVQYYENGKIKSESVFDTSKNNLGVQTFYDINGALVKKFYVMEVVQIPYSEFKDTVDIEDKMVDVLSGMEFNYHSNGKLKSKGMIVHAKKVGYWFYYAVTGEISTSEYYPCLSNKKE